MTATIPALKKGDKVHILSTARKINTAEIAPFVALLNGWGLEVSIGQSIGAEHHQFAGKDALRTADLQTAINDTKIKAIFCARGGYGTIRVVDNIDFTALKKHPKWLCGFSDITILHNEIHNLGLPSIHTFMASTFDIATPEAIVSLENALFQKQKNSYKTDPYLLNKTGTATAEIIGGNMSIIYSLLGTKSDIDTDGKILFIEDLDEYLYHIDRIVLALKRAGKFSNLAGLIIGGMTEMKDHEIPFGLSAESIIAEAIAEYTYPVAYNFPCGHIADNRALTLGQKASLTISNEGVIFKQ